MKFINSRWLSVQVHRHECTSLGPDSCSGLARAQVHSGVFNVSENGIRSRVNNRVCCCDEGEWGRDDFVAMPDTQGLKCNRESCSSGGSRDGILRAAVLCELFLKFEDTLAHDHPLVLAGGKGRCLHFSVDDW